MRLIDISLPIYEGMPVYPGTIPTRIKQFKSASGQSVLSDVHFSSHTGTHIDAPFHGVPKGKKLAQLGLESFYGSCRVLDLSKCKEQITEADLTPYNIQPGERILLKTANSKRGFKQFYEDYVYLSAEAAAYLAKIGVTLVGIDALSIKKKGDKGNSSHTNLLAKNIPIIEGLDLSKVEEGEYELIAMPIALQTDGAPTRAALVVQEKPVEMSLNKKLKLYSDGGSRGNPGPSAIAYVICNLDDNVVEKSGKYIGITTNNQAEYQGLLAGLKQIQQLTDSAEVYMDSELVVKQINGLYKIKHNELKPIYNQIMSLKPKFKDIKFIHVPRAMNSVADAEVNRILDEHKH